MRTEREKSDALFRNTGFLLGGFSALFFFLFLGTSFFDSSRAFDGTLKISPEPLYFAITGISAIGFILSAFHPSLHWFQPLILLLVTPLPILSSSSSMYSLGAFIAAEILLFRLGFFKNAKLAKFLITILYFFISEILIGVSNGYAFLQMISPVLFMCLYLGFLLLVYGDRWVVYLRDSPPDISLSSFGLSPMEGEYLKALLSGKSVKEIAAEAKVKESTVRNTLARVCKKFGLQDKAALMAACSGRRIIP